MTAASLTLHGVTFAFTLWLGLYLVARAPIGKRLLFAGLGLTAYAITILLSAFVGAGSSPLLARAQWSFIFLPATFWTGTLIQLLPETLRLRASLYRLWLYSVLPLAGSLFALHLSGVFVPQSGGLGLGLLAAVSLVPLVAAFMVAVHYRDSIQPRQPLTFVFIATLFFALAVGVLLLPSDLFSRETLVFGLGFDLILLGVSIALFDALDMGERLLPDMARSFAANALLAFVFAGQVVGAMLALGVNFPLLALLFSSLTLVTALQVFANPLQSWLDRLVFSRQPKLQRERAALRAASSAAMRSQQDLARVDLKSEDFERLTRKAFSHFGDLGRLGSSPLAQLTLITQRLNARGAQDDTLSRAQELKRLLLEAVLKLKPQVEAEFDTTDEWRHYNVLFFPYVIGIKPFSQRADHTHLDAVAKEALEYFRTFVPERTFYNWQKSAAALVAATLQEQDRALEPFKTP